jgi:hypothetical protein
MRIIFTCVLNSHAYCINMRIEFTCVLYSHAYYIHIRIVFTCVLYSHTHCVHIRIVFTYAAALSKLLEGSLSPNEDKFAGYPDPDGHRAQWYYENVSTELQGSHARQVQEAASLTEGGPDWGGMWEMARMMQAEQIATDEVQTRSLDTTVVGQIDR